MVTLLRAHSKLHEALFMAFLCLLCFALSVFRSFYSHSHAYLFLNWNLFLAFVPWFFSTLAIVKPSLQSRLLVFLTLMGSWLLFFPNAPYILTDLFHLHSRNSMPMWFDLVLILSFAWTGLLFGFLSLWDIERMLEKKMSRPWVILISTCLLFISSFGVYLGRFLRWNSWDVFSAPSHLVEDIGVRILNPLDHPKTWAVTVLMGIFLNIIYWSFRFIKAREERYSSPSSGFSFP